MLGSLSWPLASVDSRPSNGYVSFIAVRNKSLLLTVSSSYIAKQFSDFFSLPQCLVFSTPPKRSVAHEYYYLSPCKAKYYGIVSYWNYCNYIRMWQNVSSNQCHNFCNESCVSNQEQSDYSLDLRQTPTVTFDWTFIETFLRPECLKPSIKALSTVLTIIARSISFPTFCLIKTTSLHLSTNTRAPRIVALNIMKSAELSWATQTAVTLLACLTRRRLVLRQNAVATLEWNG